MVVVLDGLLVLFQLGIGPAPPVIALALPRTWFDMIDGNGVKPDGLLVLANVEMLPPLITIILSICCRPCEFHGDGVYAMPGVGSGQAFASKHMTQVATAVSTHDLCSHTVAVR